ncbi:metalloprotease [Entomophthora muscae]|uniref:Metalloprotease n=1 Tax=Entomophthora muscae TaxID=34485 RepID=A0ACC2TBV8_9FUNG|nr:metalloprotease [Entomophthora muscae]
MKLSSLVWLVTAAFSLECQSDFVGQKMKEFVPRCMGKYKYNAMKLESIAADRRKYQLLRLENGMQVLVGQDPLRKKTIVALDVRVGLRHDPPHRQGLAHLLEHLLTDPSFDAVSNSNFQNNI